MYKFVLAIAILLIILAIYTNYNEKFVNGFSETHCICSLDIDGTINCGLENAKKAIDTCKRRGCHLNINTARLFFDKNKNDLDYDKLGITQNDIKDIYTGDYNKFGISYYDDSLPYRIAKTKVNNLKKIEEKYKIPRQRIILFDDIIENINAAKSEGFSTVHANSQTCGLNQYVSTDIENILDYRN